MALKGKKRPLNNSNKPAMSKATNNEKPAAKNIKAGKKQAEQTPSKKIKAEKVEGSPTQPIKRKVETNLPGQSPPKKLKVEKLQPESSPKAETASAGKKLTPEALLKRKEKKKELRKQKRQAEGQYKPENVHSSEEELITKISQLESLPTKSKTARRKLAVLKKKLKIKQGVYEPPAPMATKQPKKAQKVANKNGNASAPLKDIKPISKIEKKLQVDKATIPPASKDSNVKKNNAGSIKKMKNAKPAKQIVKEEPEVSEEDEEDEDSEEAMDVSSVSDEIKLQDENDDDNDDAEDQDDDDDDDDDDEAEDADNDDEEQSDAEKDEEENEDQGKQEDDDDDSVDDVKSPAKNKKLPAKSPKPTDQSPKSDDSQKKKRFVLFVGNLAYSATVDDIKKHFLTKVGNVLSVRIPTNPKTNSPRGIAFIEFSNSTDYEKALSLHNSTINGRMISVQYSSGGSKKVNNRPEIIAKNKKLHALRKQGKLAGSVKDSQKRNARRNKFKSQE